MHGNFSRTAGGVCVVLLLGGMIGCGAVNVGDLAAQTANATATTLFDLFLTNLVNQMADSFDQDADVPDDNGDAENGGEDDGDQDGDQNGDQNGDQDGGEDGDQEDGGEDGGETGGDVAAGEAAYAGACTGCHGANGEGGMGPALAGADQIAALEARFAGGATHLGTTLTDQEITDVAAWLLTQ